MSFLRPEFFDIFGVAVFGFIAAVSAWALKTGNPISDPVPVLFLLIGIAGLIVDGVIVYRTYIKKQRSE